MASISQSRSITDIGEKFMDVEHKILKVMEAYRMDRHIRQDEYERPMRINKQVLLDEYFNKLDSTKESMNISPYGGEIPRIFFLQ